MDLLKTIFPYSFLDKQRPETLIIHVLVYLVAGAILGWIAGIIPFIGGLLGSLISIYCNVGWVLCVLDYARIIK